MALNPTDLGNFDLLTNMQGNILKGHGRDHTTHIFVHFDNSKKAQAKKWIKNFSETMLTSAQKQLKQREIYKRNKIAAGLFASFYLSNKGYTALGLAAPTDASFSLGMNSAATQSKLNDPLPATWDAGYQGDIHAMVLLAHDNTDEMGTIAQAIIEQIDKFSTILHIEYGHAIRNENGDGIEHFGYVDGVSQPLFLQDEVDDFKKGKTLPLQWDPEAPLSLVLVQDVPGDSTANGSYFVFRKLEQQVRAFNEAEEKLGKKLGLADEERAGAMLVGRYEDGTPLTMNEEDGIIGSGAENNFNYDNDALGAKCPFHAHIRKSNPRGADSNGLASDKARIMARRGIPYGLRNVGTAIGPSIPQMPENGVGLLFMSYQANIGSQFEFIQSSWVNNPNFPAPGNGSDPILGQGIVSRGDFAVEYNNAATLKRESFNSFVTLKGGEYFFAPSITFLKNM
jgi:Dyp-type peroxidase family